MTVLATVLTRGVTINGQLDASEDVRIDGHFNGKISIAGHELHLSSGSSGEVDVLARSVFIEGDVSGTFAVTERAEIAAGARVEGRVVAPCVVLVDGALVNGSIDTHGVDAAVSVARYRHRNRKA